MQSTSSVSKGCFVFNPRPRKTASKSPKRKKTSKRDICPSSSLLGKKFTSQKIYQAYSKTWTEINSKIEELVGNNETILNELIKFVEECKDSNVELLPTVALLTGVNQPDHYELFKTTSNEIHNNFENSRVVILQSRNCINIKSTIETMISGILDDNRNDNEEIPNYHLTRSQYNMCVLNSWYNEYGDKKPLIFITIPDLELFNSKILQDFLMILSSNYPKIQLFLILGIATDISTLHRILPFTVTSKMFLRVSQSAPSTIGLSKIVDNVILTPICPVNLSSKVFNLLIENFLFHDMSINCFLQRFKYCLMEHYYRGNIYSICTQYDETIQQNSIEKLTKNEIEDIRQLPSFRKYVENLENSKDIINILTNDEYFRKQLPSIIKIVRNYFALFQCGLRVLYFLLHDIPTSNNILFKELRSLYPECAKNSYFTLSEFNECWQLLQLTSKTDFISKMWMITNQVTTFIDTFHEITTNDTEKMITKIISDLVRLIEEFDNEDTPQSGVISSDGISDETSNNTNPSSIFSNVTKRHEMQQRVLEQANKPKIVTHFTKCVTNILNYIRVNILDKWLIPLRLAPSLHELFLFDDYATIKSHIIGAPRAVLQTALNNPQYYLQCNCCTLNADNQSQIFGTMPDVSIAYKLHIESGHTINLFDWLQAFNLIVSDGDDDKADEIHPEIQARFTRAVAELQFLGYIKSSKRKTDHVTRLTW